MMVIKNSLNIFLSNATLNKINYYESRKKSNQILFFLYLLYVEIYLGKCLKCIFVWKEMFQNNFILSTM